MATYRYVGYEILRMLGEDIDDSKININDVTFWLTVCANQLREQRLSKKSFDSGAYLIQFTDIQVKSEGKFKYSDIPMAILDLDNDNAVHTISYSYSEAVDCYNPQQLPFERTTVAATHTLYNVPCRVPSPTDPYYYRSNSINNIDNLGRFYYLGIECIDVDYVDMYLYVAFNPKNIINLDSQVPVEEDQIAILMPRVIQLIKFGSVVGKDKKNDGSDTSMQRPAQQQVENQQSQQES